MNFMPFHVYEIVFLQAYSIYYVIGIKISIDPGNFRSKYFVNMWFEFLVRVYNTTRAL